MKRCPICCGSGVNPSPHPHMCGACAGSGASTAPWDQPRRGATITLWGGEPLPPGFRVDHDHGPRERLIGQSRQTGRCLLVSWH